LALSAALSSLDLTSNRLTGAIPPELGNITAGRGGGMSTNVSHCKGRVI